MAPFEKPNWQALDYWAIVAGKGLATIREDEQEKALGWLREHGYSIDTIDCQGGLSSVVAQINRLFHWEDQFGYALSDERRNLNAVNDGFEFEIAEGAGHALQLIRPDIPWPEDAPWVKGLLRIASDHSLFQLSLGKRFFTLIVVPSDSYINGESLDTLTVPGFFYWKRPGT